MTRSIRELLKASEARLARTSDSPRLDSELLLAHVLDKPRSYLFTWPEQVVEEMAGIRFEALLERRASGEPLAYLIGSREFWSMPLRVDRNTLIPRPDTELLVEQALSQIPEGAAAHILDLGTGTGAIALAIACERPLATVLATDQSPAALEMAQVNARDLNIRNIRFVLGSWYEPLVGQSFDLIVSNPPYIADKDPHLVQGDLPHEPRSALVSGEDGLNDTRKIIAQTPEHLKSGGWLMLEHGYDQGQAVRALFSLSGFSQVKTYRDLGGQERITIGQI